MNVLEVSDLKGKSKFLVDDDTGEVLAELKPRARRMRGFDTEPAWGKAHWVHMDMIADGFTGKAEFFLRLMVYVERDGKILMTRDVKEDLMRKCNISERTLENYLYALHRGGQIYRKQGLIGVYYLNPFAYTFGPWENSKRIQNQFRVERAGSGEDDLEGS